MRLANKVALITGGTSGIGRATALLFAQEGAKVSITGRSESRGREIAEGIEQAGGKALFTAGDVRVAADCEGVVQATLEAYGRIDVLFNNAGVYFASTILGCSETEWDTTIDVNLKGTFLMSRLVLPRMIEQGGGVVINNGSGWGVVGGAKAVSYCAAKGGIVLMTKAMAIDHGGQGIRANCICPGDVETPMLTDDARQQGMTWQDYLEQASDRPMGRIGRPEEIASAALFLASDDSSFMTGATLVVDGGGTAG